MDDHTAEDDLGIISQGTGMRTKLAQIAVIGIFVILAAAILSYARGIFLPVVLALVIGTILGPITNLAKRANIPHTASAALLVLGTVGLLSWAVVLLADPVRDWIARTFAKSSPSSIRRSKR